MRCLVAISLAMTALCACTDTYHPEYHPVSVSTISQNISYPVNVQQGGAPVSASSTPGVVIVREAPGR